MRVCVIYKVFGRKIIKEYLKVNKSCCKNGCGKYF